MGKEQSVHCAAICFGEEFSVNISIFCAAISVLRRLFCLEHQGVDESDEAGAISTGGRVTLGCRLLPSYTHFVEKTKKKKKSSETS